MAQRLITETPTGSELEHEIFCLPRAGEKDALIETFRVERHGDDGTVVSRPAVTRCIECGAQVVEEVATNARP